MACGDSHRNVLCRTALAQTRCLQDRENFCLPIFHKRHRHRPNIAMVFFTRLVPDMESTAASDSASLSLGCRGRLICRLVCSVYGDPACPTCNSAHQPTVGSLC